MPSDTFTLQIFDTGISIPADHASTHLTGGTDAIPIATASTSGLMSAAQAAAVIANTDKVTNATHTGDVSGATTLTIANNAVTTAKINNGAVTTDKIAAAAVITTKIADGNVTLAKLANVAQYTVLGRDADATGGVSAVSCSALGFDLIGGADAAAMRSTLGISFPLSVSNGGTNLSSYAIGDLLYASEATTISKLPKGAANYVLHGAGSGAAPSWSQINLATDVTGILPQANGGTGGASIDTLTFDTTDVTTDALATGEIRWNDTDKTLDLKLAGDVTLQVGQENHIYAHNSELGIIPNGVVVYIYGADGNNPSIKVAEKSDATAKKTLGVTTQSIAAGEHGYVTTQGLVRGLNTSAFSSGDSLWLGVEGTLTPIEPTFPDTAVRVAIVVRDDVSQGSIFVQPQLFSDGRVSGSFVWGAGGASSGPHTINGLTATSSLIVQERGGAPVGSVYSVVCAANEFTVHAKVTTGGGSAILPPSPTVFSYIAFA